MTDQLVALLEKIDYSFNDPQLLELALTHRSYVAENDGFESNERLEFLGDSILGISVTEYIYKKYPEMAEGDLAKLRAAVVSTDSLASIGEQIGLGNCIKLGVGEDSSGGRAKKSILADGFEALLGAIYLDSGYDNVANKALSLLDSAIVSAGKAPGGTDYKTQLQELTAIHNLDVPSYKMSHLGPDHEKWFKATVLLKSTVYGTGEGSSKKQAEQMAARLACEKLNENPITENTL